MKQSLKALFYPNIPFESTMIPSIFREIYDKHLYSNIKNNNEVIIDLGANIGVVTHHLKDRAKKIYAIEPSVIHFAALKKNKEFNHWDNVELFNVAISDKEGEALLYHNSDNVTCYSLVNNFRQGGEIVKTQRLDTFFEQNNIKNVDYMKVDIEGAESILFYSEGFINVRKQIQSMSIEFHSYNKKRDRMQALVNQLKRLGFHLKEWKMRWVAFYTR